MIGFKTHGLEEIKIFLKKRIWSVNSAVGHLY